MRLFVSYRTHTLTFHDGLIIGCWFFACFCCCHYFATTLIYNHRKQSPCREMTTTTTTITAAKKEASLESHTYNHISLPDLNAKLECFAFDLASGREWFVWRHRYRQTQTIFSAIPSVWSRRNPLRIFCAMIMIESLLTRWWTTYVFVVNWNAQYTLDTVHNLNIFVRLGCMAKLVLHIWNENKNLKCFPPRKCVRGKTHRNII